MPIINVACTLEYEVISPTSFLFNIIPAKTSHQKILQDKLTLSPNVNVEWLELGEKSVCHIRVEVEPGAFTLDYTAKVELTHDIGHAPYLDEVSFQTLPSNVMSYLNPSRYCESDRLTLFVDKEIGTNLTGHAKVEAVCEWVYSHIDYIAGSTDASTSACDVLVNRAGVCRDFAHVSIALCRALGIPARYISGYAVNLQPRDFHGFFEAFLDGKWYLFDATRMAPVSGFVRIGLGRDAADASFATIVGTASLIKMEVSAFENSVSISQEGANEAISTA